MHIYQFLVRERRGWVGKRLVAADARRRGGRNDPLFSPHPIRSSSAARATSS
jgi:hypothetical protein